MEKDTSKDDGKKKYSKEQLAKAMKSAMEDGDYDLMMDIYDYKVESMKDELKDEYVKEQKSVTERAKKAQEEWQTVQRDYSYLASQNEPELYNGSRRELNIGDPTSLLYKIAIQLFNAQDPSVHAKYQGPGGQRLAVADALSYILRKRRGKKINNKETSVLKKRLSKEKRKNSLASGSPGKEETVKSKGPMSDKDRINDYIESRRKSKNALLG